MIVFLFFVVVFLSLVFHRDFVAVLIVDRGRSRVFTEVLKIPKKQKLCSFSEFQLCSFHLEKKKKSKRKS